MDPWNRLESDRPDGVRLCIHRPVLFKDGQRQTDAILYVLKSRYDELGYPCNLAMNYDLGSGCFESVGYRAAHETAA